MANTLREAGYHSCYADPDVWMKKNTKPDGFKYWEYVLCYVDDVLVVSHEPTLCGYTILPPTGPPKTQTN